MQKHLTVVLVGIGLLMAGSAQAAAKKKPEPEKPFDGKRVVELAPVEQVRLELPDQTWHDFGEDFQARLTTKLVTSGKFIVADPHGKPGEEEMSVSGLEFPPDYVWPGTMVPSANIKIYVEGFSFITGGRGGRMFYGFDERLAQMPNEFPLKTEASFSPGWFGSSFDVKGAVPFESTSGLDLDDGFSIDVLYAWLTVKYASYLSNLNLRIEINSDLAGLHETKKVQVNGKGFFVDLAGAYQGYSVGIRVARRDAVLQAFRRAIDGSYQAIEKEIIDLPLTARVDSLVQDQGKTLVLLGTGHHAAVVVGTLYEVLGTSGVHLRVLKSVSNGAIAEVAAGDEDALRIGMITKQVSKISTSSKFGGLWSSTSGSGGPTAMTVLPAETIDMPASDLDAPQFKEGEIPIDDRAIALARSVVELIFLPYRIWRYFNYDMPYSDKSTSTLSHKDEPKELTTGPEYPEVSIAAKATTQSWYKDTRKEAWAKRIGLDKAPSMKGSPLIAVIDSGVDYNHPVIHDMIWRNPKSHKDVRGEKDKYGWDFISSDGRPFDDNYHGTHVASAVLAVAPGAKILPLKVFNPWGVTNSASVYSAFVYAVDKGARVIVCGWATRTRSEALLKGIEYAKSRGVAVVVAAGDDGKNLDKAAIARYPASYARDFSNMLVVAATDKSDQLLATETKSSGFGAQSVHLAAPGKDIRVAEPRSRYDRDSSTGIAAGVAAGALARVIGAAPELLAPAAIERLLNQAERVEGLTESVRDGLRIKIQ